MKKYLTWMMALVILLGQVGCKDSINAPAELLEPVGVKLDTAVVQREEIYEIAAYQGEVVPYVEALSFPEDGYLEEIKVSVGDVVREGQVLASTGEGRLREQIEALQEEMADIRKLGEFSDRKAQLDIEIAVEELAILEESQAAAQVGHGESEASAGGEKVDEEAIAWEYREKEAQIQRLKLQLQQAQEMRGLELSQKQSSLKALQNRAGRNEITAPFNGQIVYVRPGNTGDAVAGGVPVFYLADQSRVHIEAEHISESEIQKADRIYGKIMDRECALTYLPYENDVYAAMVAAGEEIRTRFSIEAGEDALESGQFAAVMLRSAYRENVLTVPVNALYQDWVGRYVYKIEGEHRIRCDVTVGLITETKAEIVEGLKDGDVVYIKE